MDEGEINTRLTVLEEKVKLIALIMKGLVVVAVGEIVAYFFNT